MTKISYFVQFNNKKHFLARKLKQKPLEAEALNFSVLMDCLNQQKEAISLSVYKRNILVL